MIGDQLMGYEEFLIKYGRSADSLLTYNVLYNAIRPILGNIKRIPSNVIKFCKMPVGDIGRKKFLELITDKHTPHSERFWEHKFQFTFEKELWSIHSEATKEAKLLSLQWKIMQNIFPTNIYLQKIKVKETNLCEECGVLDTIEHLFVECNTVKHIWLEAERIMEQLVGRLPKLRTREYLLGLPLGGTFSKQDTLTINHICLIVKNVISKVRYGNKYNIMCLLEQELRYRGFLKGN